MSSRMKLTRTKILYLSFLTLFIMILLIVSFTDYKIQKAINEKRFLVPTRYYSGSKKFRVGEIQRFSEVNQYFTDNNYRLREFNSPLLAGDFSWGEQSQCQNIFSSETSVFRCLFFRNKQSQTLYLLAFNDWDQIVATLKGDDLERAPWAEGDAESFAQYLGDQPTQQIHTPLGDIPRYCLDAVIAIEDPQFLEHQGVSIKGLLRAVWANLRQVRWSQGGSTITQQLVKNYFLTPEKTLTRKIKEIVMSLIFELRVSKDDILEIYLNVIYLGQSGVFEVRGYGSASEFYFQKNISQLNLGECALLAAIVNSPGNFHPIKHAEKATQRRKRVLDKMLEHQMISETELKEFEQDPLPKKLKSNLAASAPYYVDAVNKKLIELGITDRSGLHVYTALEPKAQRAAEKAVRETLARLESQNKTIKKIKEETKMNLEASLIASHPQTGDVIAIVGGRNFSTSPYNRAIESQRQVGSIFKPLVFLSALQNNDDSDKKFNPLTLLDNSPMKLEYDRQIWEPQNYDKKFSIPKPAFFVLKESINVPTARLAMEVGLDRVIDTARSLGIYSPLKKYPALSLGAFELFPLEVLKVYNTFSQMGEQHQLQIIHKVTDQNKELLYEAAPTSETIGDPRNYAILVSMMKESLRTGTAKWIREWGFESFAAGKTGTTSDSKDAWFAGFTPQQTAVVWMGYDNGTPHGLTGASGALPIWVQYMKAATVFDSNIDFKTPDGVVSQLVSRDELIELGIEEEKAVDTELLFKEED